jgi:hypothetical protein
MKPYLPGAHEVIKEGLIVLAGAILAAAVIGMFPQLKAWIKTQWADTPRP